MTTCRHTMSQVFKKVKIVLCNSKFFNNVTYNLKYSVNYKIIYYNSNATIITIYLLELLLYFICHLSTIVHLRQYSNKLLEGSRSN